MCIHDYLKLINGVDAKMKNVECIATNEIKSLFGMSRQNITQKLYTLRLPIVYRGGIWWLPVDFLYIFNERFNSDASKAKLEENIQKFVLQNPSFKRLERKEDSY